MKYVLKTFTITALVFSLLLSSLAVFPVAADEYTEAFLGSNDIPAATHLDPVNPNASREAKNLLAYLQTLTDSNRFIVGTFDISDTNQVYNDVIDQLDAECALYSQRYTIVVEDNFEYEGVKYPPMSFYNHESVNKNLAEHYHKGNVLLIHGDTVIEDYLVDYVLRAGIAKDEAEADGMCLVSNLDATNPNRDPYMYSVLVEHNNNMIAALRELESMGVKAYMYRPWVEFTRFEFHGMTQSEREVSRRVWQQTSDLFKTSGLEGVLLTWAPQNRWYEHYYWYPGNEYVDIIAPTMYGVPSSEPGMGGYLNTTQNVNYDWFVKTGKPYGFSEISCRKANWQTAHADGRQSWYQTLKSIINNYPATTWVNCWADGSYSLSNHTNNQPNKGNDDGYLFLNSPFSINLGNMLDYRVTQLDSPGVVQLYTEKNFAGNDKDTLNNKWIGLEERTYTYKDLKALGLDPAKIASFHLNADIGIIFYSSDDASGSGWGYLLSQADLSKEACYGKIRSLQVIRPKLLSQDKLDTYASDNDGDAWKVNDGYGSRWTGIADDNGEGWLIMNLEEPCAISHWEVQHASYIGEVELFNTVDYSLQVSLDGKTWTTVDSVVDNAAGRTSIVLKTVVEGQYFRLHITKPNRVTAGAEKGRMTIAEWRLYGLSTGKSSQDADWDSLFSGVMSTDPKPTTKPTTTTTKKVTTTTKKTTTTTALKLATPKVTVSNVTKGIKVSWGKVSKASSYRVYRRLYSSGKWGSWSKIKTTTSLSYTDEGAKAGKNYQYMVKAVKGSVTSGYKVTATITRLTVPTVKASNASKGIKLTWGKVSKATSYRVYRRLYSSGKWGSWSRIKTTTSVSYTDTKAKVGKNYQYMVRAVKGDSTSYYKATATIRRLKAPGSIKLTKATKGFKVSWSKVTGATKYEVYRKTGNGSYTKIATTTKTAYTDKTAKKGKYYTYRVRAVYSTSKSVFKTGSKTKR